MPYHVIQTLLDPLWPKGIHAYFKATNLTGLDDALIDRLCAVHLAGPGPQCEIHVHQMGGAVARVAEGATAFPERSMPFVLNAVTGWHDTDADVAQAHADWARSAVSAAAARRHRPRIRELPQRGERGAQRIRSGEVRPARRAQERIRPDERLPAQPERRAGWGVTVWVSPRPEAAATPRSGLAARYSAGAMLRFIRNRLPGSYVRFSSASRS